MGVTSAFVYHDERKKKRNFQLGDVVFDLRTGMKEMRVYQ